MGYSHQQLFSEVERLLSTKPRLKLWQLAETLNVGHQTLAKAVKEAAGESFRDYQREKVLERVLGITNSRLLEKEIAAEIGYSSSDAFSRFIKRATGKTFADLREQETRRSGD